MHLQKWMTGAKEPERYTKHRYLQDRTMSKAFSTLKTIKPRIVIFLILKVIIETASRSNKHQSKNNHQSYLLSYYLRHNVTSRNLKTLLLWLYVLPNVHKPSNSQTYHTKKYSYQILGDIKVSHVNQFLPTYPLKFTNTHSSSTTSLISFQQRR